MSTLIVIKTIPELIDLEKYLEDKQYIAYDCETTGLDKDSEVIGFSVCAETDTAFYVVLSYWDLQKNELVYLQTREYASKFLQCLINKSLIMHNAIFDCWKAETCFGVSLIQSVHTDTMILAHLLDENRNVGLKELGVSIFGEDSRKEQIEMKESVLKNGGSLTKTKYELYKADCDLIGKYGAKDTILTLKLFYHLVLELLDQDLGEFFYEDECMPLLKGPTYDLNTSGLKVDSTKLMELKKHLEAECMDMKAFIHKEIQPYVEEKYPATNKANTFNIGSSKQLAWLLFFKLSNVFHTLTQGGRDLCHELNMRVPYSNADKREFVDFIINSKDMIYQPAKLNEKTGKMSRPKKIGDPWNYVACGKETLKRFSKKYKWVEVFLEYAKNLKLLNTYVEGLESRIKYGVIRPSFLQHGTTSGRYSSRNPNFQNLPRNDKRVKSCIVSRQNKVFVGADYSQLEPRVFASFSGDERLTQCFKNNDDFYSVIGVEVFNKKGLSLKKDDENSFASKYPKLRDVAKVVALSATYGTTASKMATAIEKSIEEAQQVIDEYFRKFPSVAKFMIQCHNKAKKEGRVLNLFGRPRRIPDAKMIDKSYGNFDHKDLPYQARNILNLSVNHTIQSTAASIMNRAAIKCWKTTNLLAKEDPRWKEVKIVMQVHDELILEGPEVLSQEMSSILKESMEKTVIIPEVDLIAIPKIGKSLAELK